MLVSLGFPPALCELALKRAGGNVEKAASALFQGEVSDEPPSSAAAPSSLATLSDSFIHKAPSGDGHDWQCEVCTFMNYR